MQNVYRVSLSLEHFILLSKEIGIFDLFDIHLFCPKNGSSIIILKEDKLDGKLNLEFDLSFLSLIF